MSDSSEVAHAPDSSDSELPQQSESKRSLDCSMSPQPILLLPEFNRVAQELMDFDYFGGSESLDSALTDCSTALQNSFALSDPLQQFRWKVLKATAHYLLFERDGQVDDSQEAKITFEELYKSKILDPPALLHVLYGLARVSEAMYYQDGSVDAMEKACEHFREALDVGTQADTIPSHLSDDIAVRLGRHLLALTNYGKGSFSEPETLISTVLQKLSQTDPLRPSALANLALVHWFRWFRGSQESKEELIKGEEAIQKALLLGPRQRYRSRFLRLYSDICMQWKTPERIWQGIGLLKEAMTLIPSSPPLRNVDSLVLNALASGYSNIFNMEGRLEDLDEALTYRFRASDSKYVHPGVLINLCTDLCTRFQLTGRLIEIDKAIQAGHLALERVGQGTITKYTRFSLGRAYLARFTAAGEQEDFLAARTYLGTGFRDDGDSDLPSELLMSFLLSLANLYDAQFAMSDKSTDLDLAIFTGVEAISLTKLLSHNEVPVPSIYSEHGARLLRRFEYHNKATDLDESISTHEDALRLSSSAYFERHLVLYGYGHALRLKFELYHQPQDFQRSSELLCKALDHAAAIKHSRHSVYLAEIAALYSARYAYLSTPSDFEAALGYYERAAQATEGLMSDRLRAASAGARFAMEHSRFMSATELFSLAVALLPRIAWLGLNAKRRHAKVIEASKQLVCDATASAIRAGQLERAVELLEHGRSILWRSVLDLRTDLQTLEDVAPTLACELLQIGEALEQDDMGGTAVPEKHLEERASRRRRTAERWGELINIVRGLEGFHSFLKPSKFHELRQAAKDGPLVILNVSKYGSDALILYPSGPVQSIPLKELLYGTVYRLAYVLAHALAVPRDHLSSQILDSVMLDVARKLWIGGLRDVAEELKRTWVSSALSLFRVWWIPTGLFSLLPIHCAGPYKAGQQGVSDLFISSYSTTLSALISARNVSCIPSVHSSSSSRMLAIGLPQTPGFPPLPSTRTEMEILQKIPAACSILYASSATVEAVSKSLSEHSWLHACCHGHLDQQHPLDSAFMLADGPLTISNVVQMRLQDAEFAFLSACHSARYTILVPDESLHMAAALQVSGYKGILGTAWSMVDSDGPQLAERFYRRLTVNGRALDSRNAAEALHFAIRDLRENGLPLHRWAAFVHFGV